MTNMHYLQTPTSDDFQKGELLSLMSDVESLRSVEVENEELKETVKQQKREIRDLMTLQIVSLQFSKSQD